MADHRLDAAPDTVHWGYLDATLKPHIIVDFGDFVTISTVSGGPQLTPAPELGFYVPDALTAIHARVQPKLGGSHIRLTNDDVIDLYNRVRIGATVIVQ